MLDHLADVLALLLAGTILVGMTLRAFVFQPLVLTKLPAAVVGTFIRPTFAVCHRTCGVGRAHDPVPGAVGIRVPLVEAPDWRRARRRSGDRGLIVLVKLAA